MSSRDQETRALVDGVEATRYDGTHPTAAQQSIEPAPNRTDDAHLAMLDPDSLSPGRKRLFVVGMVLASFLASLDLTGEPSVFRFEDIADLSSGRNLHSDDL
jgi:hypothetical protein